MVYNVTYFHQYKTIQSVCHAGGSMVCSPLSESRRLTLPSLPVFSLARALYHNFHVGPIRLMPCS